MKREQIEQLTGRELDAAVAKRVFESDVAVISRLGTRFHWMLGEHDKQVPHFSTDIAAAFEVVEEMRRRKWHLQLANNEDNGVWWASFRYRLSNNGFLQEDSYSENAAEAISRAALLAVMGEEKA